MSEHSASPHAPLDRVFDNDFAAVHALIGYVWDVVSEPGELSSDFSVTVTANGRTCVFRVRPKEPAAQSADVDGPMELAPLRGYSAEAPVDLIEDFVLP